MEESKNGDSPLALNKEDRIRETVKKGTPDCFEYLWVLMEASDD